VPLQAARSYLRSAVLRCGSSSPPNRGCLAEDESTERRTHHQAPDTTCIRDSAGISPPALPVALCAEPVHLRAVEVDKTSRAEFRDAPTARRRARGPLPCYARNGGQMREPCIREFAGLRERRPRRPLRRARGGPRWWRRAGSSRRSIAARRAPAPSTERGATQVLVVPCKIAKAERALMPRHPATVVNYKRCQIGELHVRDRSRHGSWFRSARVPPDAPLAVSWRWRWELSANAEDAVKR